MRQSRGAKYFRWICTRSKDQKWIEIFTFPLQCVVRKFTSQLALINTFNDNYVFKFFLSKKNVFSFQWPSMFKRTSDAQRKMLHCKSRKVSFSLRDSSDTWRQKRQNVFKGDVNYCVLSKTFPLSQWIAIRIDWTTFQYSKIIQVFHLPSNSQWPEITDSALYSWPSYTQHPFLIRVWIGNSFTCNRDRLLFSFKHYGWKEVK